MKHYTVGVYFSDDFKKVALILKNRPDWQKGLWNFPGGHVELEETPNQCVVREFAEECKINTENTDWLEIGKIKNNENYEVSVFTTVQQENHGILTQNEDQPVSWHYIDSLPNNIITNLPWLIEFALNFMKQGKCDKLVYGTFIYEN